MHVFFLKFGVGGRSCSNLLASTADHSIGNYQAHCRMAVRFLSAILTSGSLPDLEHDGLGFVFISIWLTSGVVLSQGDCWLLLVA